jgi:putative ABC transport system permease protein
MLIFMIFVMLAVERKPEMGMARAVGAQRSSLVQAFISEGMAYSLIAGAIGALVGVAAAIGLVAGFLKVSGGFDFIQAHITVRSLVISYSLGVVITFLTVLFSALNVSSVNIVAAIRGTEDDSRRASRRTSWRWVAAGIPAMILPPLGIWLVLRKGFGLAWAWIIAPLGIAAGLIGIMMGNAADSEIIFSFGVSVLPLCLAMLASYYRAPSRLTWTLVGLYLALYWLAPVDYPKLLLGRELDAGMEMFVLSGVMVVIAFTLLIVFNARLLTMFFQQGNGRSYTFGLALVTAAIACLVVGVALNDKGQGLGQLLYLFAGIIAIGAVTAATAVRFPHLAPALKMGVAYPLSNRLRTGMTIAMFSLIVFSLATFSAVNASFVSLLTADGGDGGWDVLATANRNSDVGDLKSELLSANAPVAGDIQSTGRVTTFTGNSQVRLASADYQVFPVLAGDEAFYSMPEFKLKAWANGYDNEHAVLEAMKDGNDFALVDPSVLPGGFNDYEFQVEGLAVENDRFEPFEIDYTDGASGRQAKATVIGILAIQVDQSYTAGVYVSETAYGAVFGEPDYLRTYVKLNPGTNAKEAAQAIESSMFTRGVQADSVSVLLDDAVAESNSFIRMFQGFMALGLITGIAALGIIAYRSVVERRQQIGMLRAIGYQTGTVAMTFILESGFIALMGILSGIVGGMIIARNLFTSGQFSGEGIEFAIPWAEIITISVTTFLVSMFMTWWPSRQAARVPVADALRYE